MILLLSLNITLILKHLTDTSQAKRKKIVQKKEEEEIKKNPEEDIPQKPKDNKPKLKKNTNAKNGSFISKGEGGETRFDVIPDKKVDIVQYSNDLVEIPNYYYIDYILSTMMNPDEENQEIKIFNDDKTHIPIHYNSLIKEKSMEKVNYFFYAAETLSASILNELGTKSEFLNNIDNCYASILIDCSNTFSNIQKASLILISIAYANSLTAFRIPYSIILFCDDNFQYIIKKLDDKHDKVNFLRLIESMTINRRMSSMSDSIQMAKQKIIPTGINSKRTNHIIYILSDGLSASLNFVKEWKKKILENKNVSVSFFSLNILSGEDSQSAIDIWSKFAVGISKAKSPTTVYYSRYDNILNNKDFFNILSKSDTNETTQLVSLSECFSNPIIQSVSQSDKKYSHLIAMKKLPKKKQVIEFTKEMLEQIERFLYGKSSNDTKYFKDCSYDNYNDDSFEIEIHQLRIDPFSVNIAKSDSADNRENYSRFCNDLFELSSTTVDQSSTQELSSYVFIPNKPSQYTPSSDGTLFYFPGLIRFLLTQGQDTKIFLEKKAGLTKSYSIFVVIDCSTSCFNVESSIHAFQSIFILLEKLSKIDIPAFNLIVTTKKGPHVLCLKKSTFDALSVYSPVWVSLFTSLLNPHEDCFLKSALLTALSIRAQEKTLSSVLFLFTDGNFSDHNLKVYNSLLDNISSYNVETITIGIGSYPSNISSLLFKKVWSANPKNISEAILSAFGKESSDLISNISSLHEIVTYKDEEERKSFGLMLAKILEFESFDDYSFKELITELNKVIRNISVFNDFYNIKSKGNEIFSEDKSHDLGKKNFYKGISILICQFWDYTMKPNEDKNVSKEVLLNGIDEKKLSVINSLKEFGIETVIVQNYKDAIFKMKEGEFSEVWVICGRYDGEMPDKTKYGNLLSQFIDCLIKYWENGGGIVFWTDNSPLVAEVNFFLSKAEFEKQQTNKKDPVEFSTVNFRIGGSYPGCQMLVKCDKARNASFNSHEKIKCDGYEKYLYNANMTKIYEGFTISSAIKTPQDANDQCYNETENYEFAAPQDFYPFHAFSKSSSGGISSLYYNAPLESPKGDIVIDCGSSKLFFELTKEGIYWYVRNIAIFMLSLEKKSSMIGGKADPREFKPKKFDFDIKPYVKADPSFYKYNSKRAVDIVFMIDGTGSMQYLINAVINVCNDLAVKCKANSADNDFKFGAVIYRDEAVGNIYYDTTKKKYNGVYNDNITEYSDLNSNIQKLKEFLQKIIPKGGGNDGPEDWVSGYRRLEKKLSWRPYSEKMVIHIADAPAHGKPFNDGKHAYPRFTNDEDYNRSLYDKMDAKQNHELNELIKWAAKFKIRFSCISNDNYLTIQSFKRAKSIYQKNNGIEFNLIVLNNYNGNNNETISNKQKQFILNKIKDVALKSIDKCVAVDDYKPLPKQEQLLPAYNPLLPTIPKPKPKPKPKIPDVHIEFKPAIKFTAKSSFADLLADQEKISENLGNHTFSPPIEKTKSTPMKMSPYSFLNNELEVNSKNSTNNENEDENDQKDDLDNDNDENENEEDSNSSIRNDSDDDDDDNTNNFNFNENDDDDDDDDDEVDDNLENDDEDNQSDSSYDDNGAEFEEF